MEIKNILVGISIAEHMGDVNEYLPLLCKALDLPAPKWCDDCDRLVMGWETDGYHFNDHEISTWTQHQQ